jgi:hypothetical protein
MEIRRLFNFRGLNVWVAGAAIGLNLFGSIITWLFGFIITSGSVNVDSTSTSTLFQVGTLLVHFLGPFLIGWLAGAMAADGRGPPYGLLGSFGAVIPVIVVILPSGPTGLFGLILIFTSLMGGFNGGLFSLRRPRRD